MLLEQLQLVFRKVFEDTDLIITSATSAKDIKMWDSLTHLQLIAEIESQFKIKFSFEEVMMFHSVADILKVIKEKIEVN